MVCVCGRQTCEGRGCSIGWYLQVRTWLVAGMVKRAFWCCVLSVLEVLDDGRWGVELGVRAEEGGWVVRACEWDVDWGRGDC